jgi:methylthioribose-1-phosphate isomerase
MTNLNKNTMLNPIYWDCDKDCLIAIDQRALPDKIVWLEIKTFDEIIEAITTLTIRGAPLLGVAATFAIYLGVRDYRGDSMGLCSLVEKLIVQVSATRPTAVNLFIGLRRAQEVCNSLQDKDIEVIEQAILDSAENFLMEERQRSFDIAKHGAVLISDDSNVLTHCNAGMLAVGGIGTALGIIYEAHKQGKINLVYVDETRPLLQGARLTAWELSYWGIKHRLIVDSAASYLISLGKVDYVIVGADRIARNGDVANKIGTYSLSLAANRAQIPFIVAAPLSSFDLSLIDGSDIEIEERDENEVLKFRGIRTAPESTKAFNPAFDITPVELIYAIVTEKGVIFQPNKLKIADHISTKDPDEIA